MASKQNVALNKFKGMLLSFLAGTAYAMIGIGAKFLVGKGPADITFIMNLSSTVYNLPFFIKMGSTAGADKKVFFFVLLIGALLSSSAACRYTAVKTLPLGVANVIGFSTPFFVTLIARIALKERISRVVGMSILLAFVGLCLVVKLPDIIVKVAANNALDLKSVIGSAYGFWSVISLSTVLVIGRNLRHVNSNFLTMMCQATAAILTACLSPLFGGLSFANYCSFKCVIYVGLGFCGFLTSLFTVMAVKFEEAAIVSLVMLCTDVVLGFLAQTFIFGEPIEAYSLSGAILILMAGLALPVRKWIMSLPEESKLKKKMKWVDK